MMSFISLWESWWSGTSPCGAIRVARNGIAIVDGMLTMKRRLVPHQPRARSPAASVPPGNKHHGASLVNAGGGRLICIMLRHRMRLPVRPGVVARCEKSSMNPQRAGSGSGPGGDVGFAGTPALRPLHRTVA
jgi:hypothetical protein